MEHDNLNGSVAKGLSNVLEHSVVGSEDKLAGTLIQFFSDDEGEALSVLSSEDAKGVVCCAACGKHVNARSAQKIDLLGRKTKRIGQSEYICGQCFERISDVVTPRMLLRMTADQIRLHLEEADSAEELYRTQFKATRTFRSGKKLDRPAFEVDETHGWWAIPNAKNPMVFSLDKIVDAKMRIRSTRFFSDLESSISINKLVDAMRKIARSILVFFMAKKYQSGYPELPSIPDEEQPYEMTLRLKLDDDHGLTEARINLAEGPKSAVPRNAQGAYECAHEIIEYLTALQNKRFRSYENTVRPQSADDSAWLKEVVERSGVTNNDLEFIRYYVNRIPMVLGASTGMGPFYDKLTLVNNVTTWLSDNLCMGFHAPSWDTQQSADPRAFVGAFIRYAPNVSYSDIVCIHDESNMMTGKGGMLLATDCFAVDTVNVTPDERRALMPVRYDDLLCVCMGTESWSALKLFYRNGREQVIFVDKYAHYLFAAVNCILYLRSVLGSYPSLMDDAGQANAALSLNAAPEHDATPTSTPGAPARAVKGYPFGAHGGTPGPFNRSGKH